MTLNEEIELRELFVLGEKIHNNNSNPYSRCLSTRFQNLEQQVQSLCLRKETLKGKF